MNINLIYDSSVNSAPSAFKVALTTVVQFLDTMFTNPITVNVDVGFGEIAGQSMGSGALGESETYYVHAAEYSRALGQSSFGPSATNAGGRGSGKEVLRGRTRH